MNVLSAQYYAERIASDCGAVHWLSATKDSEQAKDSAEYLSVKMVEALAMSAPCASFCAAVKVLAPRPASVHVSSGSVITRSAVGSPAESVVS